MNGEPDSATITAIMKPDELATILRDTLFDQRLSRSEKRALGEVIDELAPSGQQLANLRRVAFELAAEELESSERNRKVLDWLEDVVKVLTAREREEAAPVSEAHFSPGDKCLRRIVSLLMAAQRSVDICVFTITDNRISRAIIDCHRREVAVRVISDDDKAFDRGSDVEQLKQLGIPLRVDRSRHHMHHKFAVFDGRLLLTGSYNWTRSAAEHNYENMIVTDDPRLAGSFTRAFEELWEELA